MQSSEKPIKMKPQLMLVQNPPPITQSTKGPSVIMMKGQSPNSVLVPVNFPRPISTGGALQPQGFPRLIGQPLNSNSKSILVPVSGGITPKAQSTSTKPVIIVPAGQVPMNPKQQVLIPVQNGAKGTGTTPIYMVPATSSSNGQTVSLSPGTSMKQVNLCPSNAKSLLKGQIESGPKIHMVPAGLQTPQLGQNKQKVIYIPPAKMTALGNSKQTVVLASQPQTGSCPAGSVKQAAAMSSVVPSPNSVLFPNSNFTSLPKGATLIPISNPSDFQTNRSGNTRFPPGKVVFIPNPSPGNVSKNVIIDKKTGAKIQLSPMKNTISLSNRSNKQIKPTYNIPIKPKPSVESADTFFKTPIEIKPLEEQNDADLDDVLSALTGGGNVDLLPVENDAVIPLDTMSPNPKHNPSKSPQQGVNINASSRLSTDSLTEVNQVKSVADTSDSQKAQVVGLSESSINKRLGQGKREAPTKNIEKNDQTSMERSNVDELPQSPKPLSFPMDIENEKGVKSKPSGEQNNEPEGFTKPNPDHIYSEDKNADIVVHQKNQEKKENVGSLGEQFEPKEGCPLNETVLSKYSKAFCNMDSSAVITDHVEQQKRSPILDRSKSLEDDPDLMRGDCLQVRLAQQAARQLQEQMNQPSPDNNSDANELQRSTDEEDSPTHSERICNREDDKDIEKSITSIETIVKDQEYPPINVPKSTDTENNEERKEKLDKLVDANASTSSDKPHKKDESHRENQSSKGDAEIEEQSNIEKGFDEAQKAIAAAALNGCEVADSSELNEMFDELISEYFNAPERPKPTVIVRNLTECQDNSDRGAQSLVATKQESLKTKVTPGSLNKNFEPTNKQYAVKTSAGTFAMVQVKVPVPGKPGTSAIQYITMPISKDNQNKSQFPKYVKILPSASVPGAKTTPGPLSILKSVSPSAAGSNKISSSAVDSLLKNMLCSKSNINSTTPVSRDSSSKAAGEKNIPSPKPLSNEDLASAVSNAARNVLFQSSQGSNAKRIFPKQPSTNLMKVPMQSLVQKRIPAANKNMQFLSPDNKRIIVVPPGMKLVQVPGGVPQIVNSSKTPIPNNQATSTPSNLAGLKYGRLQTCLESPPQKIANFKNKKKKKKKKLIKYPKTKKCSVVLQRLNMKVVKQTVNLKRIRTSLLFESIPKQPMRGAKRKAEVLKKSEVLSAKSFKKEESKTEGPSVAPGNVTTTNQHFSTPNIVISSSSHQHFPQTMSWMTKAMQGDNTNVQGMDMIRQVAVNPSPVSTNIQTYPKIFISDSTPISTTVTSPMSTRNVNIASNQTNASKSITLTLSCTTASSSLTATGNKPLVSSSLINLSNLKILPADKTILVPSSGSLISSPAQVASHSGNGSAFLPRIVRPNLPPLQQAKPLPVLKCNASTFKPMPALLPAPRVGIPVNQTNLTLPSQGMQTQPLLPVLTPRPSCPTQQGINNKQPIIIQPNSDINTSPSKEKNANDKRPPIIIQPNSDITAPIPCKEKRVKAKSKEQTDKSGRKFFLVKTSSGQFLVPMQGQGFSGTPASSPNLKFVEKTNLVPVSSHGKSQNMLIQCPITNVSNISKPAIPILPKPTFLLPKSRVVDSASNITTPALASDSSSFVDPKKRKKEEDVIIVKDEPVDEEYDRYDIRPPPSKVPRVEKRSSVEIKQEKALEDLKIKEQEAREKEKKEESKEPTVPASINHMKRIEELKARLKQHEDELAALRKARQEKEASSDS